MNLESEHYLNRNEYRPIILFFFFFLKPGDVYLGRFKFTHVSTEGNYSSSEMFLQVLVCVNTKNRRKALKTSLKNIKQGFKSTILCWYIME